MDSTSARRLSNSPCFPRRSLKYFRDSQVRFHDLPEPVRSTGGSFLLRRNVRRHRRRPCVRHRHLRRAAQTQPLAPALSRRTPVRRKAILVKSSWRYSLQALQPTVPPLATDHPTASKPILHLTDAPALTAVALTPQKLQFLLAGQVAGRRSNPRSFPQFRPRNLINPARPPSALSGAASFASKGCAPSHSSTPSRIPAPQLFTAAHHPFGLRERSYRFATNDSLAPPQPRSPTLHRRHPPRSRESAPSCLLACRHLRTAATTAIL